VFTAQSTIPTAVFPGIVEAVVFIVAASIVTYPAGSINVRIVRVTVMILKVPALVILVRMPAILPGPLCRSSAGILAVYTIATIIVFRECR
jgi:hypothetical protein